ncbi:MAG: hypothetical protein E7554_10340 [Ruminococcaceae bacterium]|nr:hypothetical protein [Oscillospiraceae bacterium]
MARFNVTRDGNGVHINEEYIPTSGCGFKDGIIMLVILFLISSGAFSCLSNSLAWFSDTPVWGITFLSISAIGILLLIASGISGAISAIMGLSDVGKKADKLKHFFWRNFLRCVFAWVFIVVLGLFLEVLKSCRR